MAWDRLDELVPDNLDRYWQLTLEFLKIAREAWPAILAERGRIEPAARRDALIGEEAARLAGRTDGPVIAAGSTGSMPATAELTTIARLEHGAGAARPRHRSRPGVRADRRPPRRGGARSRRAGGRASAIRHAGAAAAADRSRDAVTALAEPGRTAASAACLEALRPAAVTDHWQRLASADVQAHLDAALKRLAVIEAANAEEEALAVAVALRETVETPEKTAALVTPDRALARRVLAALSSAGGPGRRSWRRSARRHGGRPFAQLAAEAVLGDLGRSPCSHCSSIRWHGSAAPKRAPVEARGRSKWRCCAGRGRGWGARGSPRRSPASGRAWQVPAQGAVRSASSDPRTLLSERELDAAAALLERLTPALAPLETLPRAPRPFAEIAACHRDVVAALSADAPGRRRIRRLRRRRARNCV